MTAATWTKAGKLAAFVSYRVATRRYCLTLLPNRSATFRSRSRCQSTRRGALRQRSGSTTGSAPRAWMAATGASLS